MALDLQNSKASQNKSSVSAAKAGVSPGAELTSSTTSAGAQVEITKPAPAEAPSQFELRPPKFWLIFGGLVVVALVVIVSLAFFVRQKKSTAPIQSPTQISEAKVVESSPVALPAIKSDDSGVGDLKGYFILVSPVFSEAFMAQVPEIAKDAYKKYQETSEPIAKLEAARAFYIYLNNPGSKTGDPLFKEFLGDVKFDLEKTLGRHLFGE